MNREIRDYIEKLLEISLALQKLAFSEDISYQKSEELRSEHEKAYNKWLFYKNLQIELSKPSKDEEVENDENRKNK